MQKYHDEPRQYKGYLKSALRLEEVIRAAGSLPADQIIAGLYGAVTEFAGGTKQQDDLTAVIIKRTQLA